MDTKNKSLPSYIGYLLSPSTPLDFHITVGNRNSNSWQRFGVVKWMLIARSEVLRRMLLESKLRHEEEFDIPDLDPETFRHFLVYLYGHDITSSLDLEGAVKLLIAAEKYDVSDLKSKLGEVIQARVTVNDVFVILRDALVCERVPGLWDTVTTILQHQTEEVFSHPQFLTANTEVVLYIVQQDYLSVTEISVWKAVLNWANHQLHLLNLDFNRDALRSVLQPILKHTRLCTMSPLQFCQEVVPTGILSSEEVEQICLAIGRKEKSDKLINICNEIQARQLVSDSETEIFMSQGELSTGSYKNSKFYLLTKESSIELREIVCQGNKCLCLVVPPGLKYLSAGSVKISKVTNFKDNTSTEPIVEVEFKQDVEYDQEFQIPLHLNNHVLLSPNNKYVVEFAFLVDHRTFLYRPSKSQSESHHVTVNFEIVSEVIPSVNNYGSHLKTLCYKVVGSKT